jgi:hypothetical protein
MLVIPEEIPASAPFARGTTIIAAERTGRRSCGIEIDPIYVDTIIRRWQAFTGDDARHLATGQSFTEFETERGGYHGG